MADTFKVLGSSLALNRVEWAIDPNFGDSKRLTWEGTEAAILGQLNAYALANIQTNAGWRVVTTQDGPKHILEAIQQTDVTTPTEDDVTDQWTITTEIVAKSVFSHPSAMQEAESYGEDYRKEIEDKVEDPASPTPDVLVVANGFTFAQALYRLLRLGTDSYETETLVLRRVRTVPSSNTNQLTLFSTTLRYHTAQLNVPGEVRFQIPDTSLMTAPTGFSWSWRLRTQESTYQGNKAQQIHEWILAAWSTDLYPASAPGTIFA